MQIEMTDKDKIIKGLVFKQTCEAYPEQYEVFNGKGKQVGYLRLRFGQYTIRFPNAESDELLYSKYFIEDNFMGSFKDTDQRELYLNLAAKLIKNKIKLERYYEKH